MNKLNREEIEFITKCLNEDKSLPGCYRYIIHYEKRVSL